jgi:hypothetical protein
MNISFGVIVYYASSVHNLGIHVFSSWSKYVDLCIPHLEFTNHTLCFQTPYKYESTGFCTIK